MVSKTMSVNGRPTLQNDQGKYTNSFTRDLTTKQDSSMLKTGDHSFTAFMKSQNSDQYQGITRLRRSISGYPITTPLIPVSYSVTSNAMTSNPVNDNAVSVPISESVSLRQSTLRHQLTGSVTYSSTESTSNEMTTLSAEDIGINQLERFKMLTENVKLVVDSLFEIMRTSEESSLEQIASISDYPTIPRTVIENVKNCTDLQLTFQHIFDLVYDYERRISRCRRYLYNTQSHPRSWVRRITDVDQRLWSLLVDISNFVIPVPITDEVISPIEYVTVLETLATLSVQTGVIHGIFEDLKRC